MKKNQTAMDLTTGSIWKQLLLFALPLLASSFIQQLYNTVDLLFVGNLVGKEASAAIGSSGLIVTCVIGFFTGMSVGAGVITAQRIGAGDRAGVKEAVHTAVTMGLLGGACLSAIGFFCAPVLLQWMNVPAEIMGEAADYLKLYFVGLFSIVTFNMCAGIIRATGNSRVPMIIQLMGGIINVGADAFFVAGLRWGVKGAAMATLFSQTTAAVLSFIYLLKEREEYRIQFSSLRIHRDSAAKILKIGIPAGIQSLVIEISNVLIQYQINSFDVDAIAAFAVYFQAELPVYYPIASFGQAATTFAGQNIGAGNLKRMKQGTKICILMGIAVTLMTSGFMVGFSRQIFWMFNKDEAVISYGIQAVYYSFPFYWLYVILEVLASAIRGSGKSAAPMFIIMGNLCILRSILLFAIMSVYHDIRGVAIVYPVTWFLTAVCMILYYKFGRWEPEGLLDAKKEK